MSDTKQPEALRQIVQDLRGLLSTATPGTWTKGRTTHHTVSQRQGEKPYPIAEFHHANDAAFCDFAHNFIPQVLDALDAANARIAELETARFAYASEFEPDADGDPDVGSIHANIRALKAQLSAIGAGGVEPLRKRDADLLDAFCSPGKGSKAARRMQTAQPSLECLQQSAPHGWENAIAAIRSGLDEATPSSYDNSGYRAFAASVLDSVCDELAALQAAPPAPAAVAVPFRQLLTGQFFRFAPDGPTFKRDKTFFVTMPTDGHTGRAMPADLDALVYPVAALAAAPAQEHARATPDSSEIVSEAELQMVFAGTNFGTSEHRHLLHQAVLKKACGYHCGHTITMIMRELGLICKKEPLLPTRKGRDLMRIAFREQMMEGP